MSRTFVTFGQIHTHSVNGKTFDKNCVAVINHEGEDYDRERTMDYFGITFCTDYPEEDFDFGTMHYYPRGLIEVN